MKVSGSSPWDVGAQGSYCDNLQLNPLTHHGEGGGELVQGTPTYFYTWNGEVQLMLLYTYA